MKLLKNNTYHTTILSPEAYLKELPAKNKAYLEDKQGSRSRIKTLLEALHKNNQLFYSGGNLLEIGGPSVFKETFPDIALANPEEIYFINPHNVPKDWEKNNVESNVRFNPKITPFLAEKSVIDIEDFFENQKATENIKNIQFVTGYMTFRSENRYAWNKRYGVNLTTPSKRNHILRKMNHILNINGYLLIDLGGIKPEEFQNFGFQPIFSNSEEKQGIVGYQKTEDLLEKEQKVLENDIKAKIHEIIR